MSNQPKCYAKNRGKTAKLLTVSYSLCRNLSSGDETFLGTVIFDESFDHSVFNITIEFDCGTVQEFLGCVLLGLDGEAVPFGFVPEVGNLYNFRVDSATQDGVLFYLAMEYFYATADKEEEDHEGQIYNEYTGEWVWL